MKSLALGEWGTLGASYFTWIFRSMLVELTSLRFPVPCEMPFLCGLKGLPFQLASILTLIAAPDAFLAPSSSDSHSKLVSSSGPFSSPL